MTTSVKAIVRCKVCDGRVRSKAWGGLGVDKNGRCVWCARDAKKTTTTNEKETA